MRFFEFTKPQIASPLSVATLNISSKRADSGSVNLRVIAALAAAKSSGGLASDYFAAGGLGTVSAVGGGAVSAEGMVPRSSDAPAQSPAQSLVPFTVPTSLQPICARGFTCPRGLPPTFGAGLLANALAEKKIVTKITNA